MEVGRVRLINIDEEMQQAYLDYAMSVIVSRALPDARDGLKPVHRRILYAMHDMGLRPNTGYKKSARVVGEVLGKYHPHSDTAVYDAMARMAQDFSMRLPLVDGQGNFGSVDGDSPAAMRYTEARMASPTVNMLQDIQKNTVDFGNNFDETLQEPVVLPAAIPNLLVNGATGIAVGMSTSVPPHNLGEVIDALIYLLDNWSKVDDIDLEKLMEFIKGPDFPTGGAIIDDSDALMKAYGIGRGRVTVQAVAHMEEMGRGRERIIVTELPYMTNKASLIERIANLTRDGKLEGISDLRDESDRTGMRIVIELQRGADSRKLLSDLYKRTPMKSTFSIIMLALVNDEPTLLTLKQALRVYLEHRLTVIQRRSEYDLERARARAHILDGLRVALKNLEEIIELIRSSRDVDNARNRLMKRYKLSEIQANAILDMPLRRLAALERKKIETEYKEVQREIKYLEDLLASPAKMRKVVADELLNVKEEYADRRRTQIVQLAEGQKAGPVLTAKDMVEDKFTWVSVDGDGKIARSPEDKQPRLWGSAAVEFTVRANTRDTLYLIAEDGKTAAIPVHAVPEADAPENGAQFAQVSPLREGDKLATLVTLPPSDERAEGWYIFFGTRGGMVKKSELAEMPGPSAQTFQSVKVNDGDRLGWVQLTDGSSEILLATAQGMAIRFTEEDVRPMGLVAAGVNGIKLKGDDEVIGMDVVDKSYETFLLASDSKGKRLKMSQFPTQGRYGQGVIAWKLPDGVQLVGMTVDKYTTEIGVHRIRRTPRLMRLDSAPVRTRPSDGKLIFDNKEDAEELVKMVVPWEVPDDLRKTKQKRSTSSTKSTSSKSSASSRKSSGGKTSAAKKSTSSRSKKTSAAKQKTTSSRSKSAGSSKKKTSTRKSSTTKKSSSSKKKRGDSSQQTKMDI
ncbi:MAG: DNA gyrase subunit A [Anaerolineales bacterium]|nr:DNA gyrase subunit A [Anaerolineales bacterium]